MSREPGLDACRALRLFDGLDEARIAPVLAGCERRALAPGEVLITPGCANRTLFLLLDGRLQIRLDTVDDHDGFPVDAGEMVGEMSVIDGQLTTAWVVAERPSTVLLLPDTVLWDELAPLPGLVRNLLRRVSERSRARSASLFEAHRQRLRFEELERELAHARDIQTSLLPQHRPLLPAFDGIDVDARMIPAREVGGDFYDVFALDATRICLVVGDVSGKGMPAALFMMRVLTQLRAEARSADDLGAMLARLNSALAADNAACMFVTLVVVIVDVGNGSALIASAGHDAPIARLGDAGWQVLPRPAGPLLGVIDGARYATLSCQLQPGDRLLLYTDGVTEAEDPQRALFGLPALLARLEAGSDGDSATRVADLVAAVDAHAAGTPPSDDLTVVALRIGRR